MSYDKEMKMVAGVVDYVVVKLKNDKKIVFDIEWSKLEDSIETYIADKYGEIATELYYTEMTNDEIYDLLKKRLMIEAELIIKNSL